MTKEELLKKIDFEKNWLYECGIFGSDVDIAFHAIKKSVIEAFENEPKEGHWVRDTITDLYHCSICRSICHQDPKSKDDYCRYCGARMIEPQESEVLYGNIRNHGRNESEKDYCRNKGSRTSLKRVC